LLGVNQPAIGLAQLFGRNLDDPKIRARIFEVCDFIVFEGASEEGVRRHRSIP
jgi:hypothetical protein